jgi:hypothetical protein
MLRPRGDWVIGTAVILLLAAGWPAGAGAADGGTPPLKPPPQQGEGVGEGALPGDLLTRSLLTPWPAAETPSVPLYRHWAFWAVAGALVVGAAVLTYAVTRPAPTPYDGNIQPGVITLP